MAFEKLFNELYAVVMLKYFWKPYVADFIKEESPDWVSHTLDLGMEVSQALLQQDGEAQKFIELYLGKRAGKKFPKVQWNAMVRHCIFIMNVSGR